MRVLIIDDEVSVAELIRRVLTNQGYECVTATSPNEADALISEGTFEAVTLDLTSVWGR